MDSQLLSTLFSAALKLIAGQSTQNPIYWRRGMGRRYVAGPIAAKRAYGTARKWLLAWEDEELAYGWSASRQIFMPKELHWSTEPS